MPGCARPCAGPHADTAVFMPPSPSGDGPRPSPTVQTPGSGQGTSRTGHHSLCCARAGVPARWQVAGLLWASLLPPPKMEINPSSSAVIVVLRQSEPLLCLEQRLARESPA